MKKLMRTFALMAVAALGLSACTGEKLVPDNGNADGKFVTVHFGAEAAIEGATKATLTTEDELTFKSAWENGDVLSVKYSNDNTTAGATTSGVVSATWTTDHFEAALQKYNGTWDYNVVYPAPDAESKVDFGSARTQKGNAYNSKYDLMKGSAIEENADAGKTADGQNIVFNMTRQTAIAYFHLTSTLDEDVVSAKLSVEGGNIASSLVMLLDHTDGFDLSTEDLNEITITFEEGTAPKASNFQLWYNVLPTTYTKMTLTVETTGHTMTISRTAEDMYLNGKLYKVVKEIPADKWVSKAAYTGGDLEFDFKTVEPEGWPTTAATAAAGTYKYTVNGVDYSFIHGEEIYCGGTAPTSAYLMIVNGSSLGLPAIAGYKLVKVVGTLNDSGSPSTASKVSITDGSSEVTGGAEQTWGTKGGNYTYSLTETEENTVYYLSVSNRNCQMIKLVLSYEPATPSATKYAVSFATVESGSFSASPSKAEAGAEVTLMATPAEGYAFNNDWSVKGADETAIEVVDGKFTMPAQNVTVSGTFSKVAYTITKAAAENGSFIVKKGDAEVTTAFKGDKLTLEATPAEGYTLGNWTVTYIDGETKKSVSVNANTFYMPSANVTVSATFVEAAAVPVYASVAELIAAGKPTKDATKVTVTLKDEEITKFYKTSTYTNGVYFMVGTQEVQIYCKDTPSDWEIGGTISGTLTNCDWKLYVNKDKQETWELCPADYSELTYKAPMSTCATPVITIAEGGVVSITCETTGATIHYTVGDSPADPTEADAVFSAVTLTGGQTIKAIAVAEGYKPSAVASKKYTVGGAEAVLVWDDDFSSNTKANTTALKSLNGSKTGFKDAYTTVENCYPEVSSIKLSSSKTIGSIQTPKFTRLSGTSSVTVTIEYAGYGTDKGTLNLSVVGNGKLSVQSLTATSTAKSGADVTTWDKATFVISGADKETALKLTASAKEKSFFINSIKIETN